MTRRLKNTSSVKWKDKQNKRTKEKKNTWETNEDFNINNQNNEPHNVKKLHPSNKD